MIFYVYNFAPTDNVSILVWVSGYLREHKLQILSQHLEDELSQM